MNDTISHKFESSTDFIKLKVDYFPSKKENNNEEFLKSLEKLCQSEIIDKDIIELDSSDAKNLSSQYINCLKIISDLEKKKEIIKQKLINLSEGKNIKCGSLTLYSVVKKGNVDYKSIPGMEFIDLDKYRKEPSQYWKINIGN